MPLIFIAGFLGLETWGIVRMAEGFGGRFVAVWLLSAVLLGASLIIRGGSGALSKVRLAMARNALPAAEIFQALIHALAGLLLIAPGFITDVLGLSLLISGAGIKQRLGERLADSLVPVRPDLNKPVTLEGQYRRKP